MTKYDFKEKKMFCKHCGKNIYDLEKCPFCNDGEKLDGQANEKMGEAEAATSNNGEIGDKDAPVYEQKEKIVAKTEKKVKAENFNARLKRESKGYKTICILNYLVSGFKIAIPVFCFIKNYWFDERGSRVQYVLSKTLYEVAPTEILLILLSMAFGVALTIVYVNASKKRNATDKELLLAVDDEFRFETSSLFEPLHALSFRYDKSLFVVCVFKTVFSIAGDFIWWGFMERILPNYFYLLKAYGILSNELREEFLNIADESIMLIKIMLVTLAITFIIKAILGVVRNIKMKAIREKTGVKIEIDRML